MCHGDIKSENVLVTSGNWVLLTDFAPFKPTFLPVRVSQGRGRPGGGNAISGVGKVMKEGGAE